MGKDAIYYVVRKLVDGAGGLSTQVPDSHRGRMTKAKAMDAARELAGEGAEFFATDGAPEFRAIGYDGAGGRYILIER